MGNRLFKDLCLRCGDPLIADSYGTFGDYHMCSKCDDYIRGAIYQVNKNGLKKGVELHRHEHPIKHITGIYKPADE